VVTAVAATTEALRLAGAWQPALNCFVSLDEENALDRARQVDALPVASGASALTGVPVGFKDVFVRRGRRPRAGSAAAVELDGAAADVDTTLRAAGTVDIGSLHLDELAYAVTGRSEALGDCRNPWDLRRATGGSSSGPAAAVAAGIVPLAVGTDTGGSVRLPAAWCGVLGLKPTYSAISTRGVLPLSPSHDTVGLLARDVALLRAAYRALAAAPHRRPTAAQRPSARPLLDLPVGVLALPDGTDLDADLLGALATVSQVLARLGASVGAEAMPDLGRYNAAAAIITASEAAALHGRRRHPATAGEPWADYQAGTRTRLRAGTLLSSGDYVDALRFRGRAVRLVVEGLFSRRAVLMAPVAPTMPPLVEELASTDSTDLGRETARLIEFTRPFSFLGLPSLAVPAGFSADGLPMAVQLVAGPWQEEVLLDVAEALQPVLGWSQRRPVLPPSDQWPVAGCSTADVRSPGVRTT